MKQLEINNFKGILDSLEPFSIPRGFSSGSKNWITKGDKIELVRGYQVLGTQIAGVGRVTGLRVVRSRTGVAHIFFSHGKSLYHWDGVAEDYEEVGTNLLGDAADGEDVAIDFYNSFAGDQVWVSSPNSGLWKIMMANPTDAVDQYNSAKNYKGFIKIKNSRMRLWNRNEDKVNPYLSYIDSQNYTAVSSEAISGSGATRSGTLAFKGGGAKRTCFGVLFTDGTETFTDNFDGTLTGSAGGTGTINYATGVFSITFAASAGSVTADYQWEDSTNGGIADFTYADPTRVAGTGLVFTQAEGAGELMNILTYNKLDYCMHRLKTWELNIALDDTDATNLPYREKVGIPYWRAAVETGDGVYYIDDTDENDPQIRILTIPNGSTYVIPQSISKQLTYEKQKVGLDLSNYRFDKCAGIEFGDLILFACRQKNSAQNDTVIVYDKNLKSLDKLDYFVSCWDIYNGTLIAGDSATNNIQELFSGFDMEDSLIDNFYDGNQDNLDWSGQKKCKRYRLRGEISPTQKIKVYGYLDNGDQVEIKANGTDEFLTGQGSYVDRGQRIDVGSLVIGQGVYGGGNSEITAYPYQREVMINQDKFELIKIRIVATGIGYISISKETYYDIRYKDSKIPKKYRP